MTQPGEVRVTVALVCPAGCRNGDRRILLCYDDKGKYPLPESMGDARYTYRGTCPTCHGSGVVWEPVTCDDCAHSAHAGPNLFCDLLRCRVDPGFACQSWAPLMVVSQSRS